MKGLRWWRTRAMFGLGPVGAAARWWLSRRHKGDVGIDAAGQFAACAAMYYELADAGRAMGKDPLEIEIAEERGDGARQVAHRLLYRATGDWGAAKANIDEYIGKARRVWRSQLRKEEGVSPSCLSDMSKCLRLSDLQDKLLAEMRANPLD